MNIGRLERVSLREVWRHEAYDFTAWLQENTDVLNDVIDIRLENVKREQAAGSFSVDLLGEDGAGNRVVIENQYGKSDHDHLGKVITYLSAFEAKTAIWIVEDPRPEHVAAITWLNQSPDASFYLLKAEAVRIGDSLPAPLLTRIVGPSEATREVGETKRELAERQHRLQRFWAQLLDRARARTQLHANISPSRKPYISTSGGKSGLSFGYVTGMHDARVEFYIDRPDVSTNKMIFDRLAAMKDDLEMAFQGPLVWERLDEKRACRISSPRTQSGYQDDEAGWEALHDQLVDAMIRLEGVMRPQIDLLPQ
jgi:hypothetical protein